MNAVEAAKIEDNEEFSGPNVVARSPAVSSVNEVNFNLVYDDFNLASVSMPYFISLIFSI